MEGHGALQDVVFTGELMVESNVTLEATTILLLLNTTGELQVTGSKEHHTVTLLCTELVAECLIVGDESTCNCSNGYIWSNEVCYTHKCCNETSCSATVSDITPLCIAKVKVHINGSVTLSATTWDFDKTAQLVTAFKGLNGFEYLNVTVQSPSNNIADFEAAVSVKFKTSKLQSIVTELETNLGAVLLVDTLGMVTIKSPNTTVSYMSTVQLKCTFKEATGSAGWNISKKHERFGLNTGSVVKLNHSCSTEEYESCTEVTLDKVTGIWKGTYECGFTDGSVRHVAMAYLKVALLPDVINLKINPLTADCTLGAASVNVTASILCSTESFEVRWTYNDEKTNAVSHTCNDTYGDNLIYDYEVAISCQKTTEAQYVNITFQNSMGQEKSARVDIPVIYEGEKYCSEEVINGEIWPKTPAKDTVINRTCGEGRVGYKSRTCDGTSWQLVYSYCVSQNLTKIFNDADNFQKGLGATQETAMNIFGGLWNSSSYDSDPSDAVADITASINVLDVMSSASENVVLQEGIFPDFVNAASNMLNKTWNGVNTSTVEYMSSTYLQSVEGLVKNIKVTESRGLSSENLDLKFCSGSDCNVSVLDINVTLNKTSGLMKTVAVKNLTNRLKNSFSKTEPTGLLLMATLEESNDSSLEIELDFPRVQMKHTQPICVFWNITAGDWSKKGCTFKITDENRTLCMCYHLTSFSVLMSKSDISTDVLTIITNVGLGVSVSSLLIFLIIESLVWSAVVKSNLSHFRHTALVNIAVFLLLADCSFLASKKLSSTWCLVLTVSKHLFYLAMFSWMLCMSVMLIHQLIFVFSPLRKRVFMFISSIVGYVCPILIVGSSYVHCKYTNKPYYNPETCWLVFEKLLEGSVHAFLLPVGTVILTNLFSMVVVVFTLMKSSVPDGSKADDKETVKSILKVVVFLTPVFGVTWGIGFMLFILDEKNAMYTVADYSFTILNSFQGLSILLTGCLAEQKVRGELSKLILAKSKGKSESMTKLNSTAYTKDK
ncbi:adhesion G-protein coupled receptor F2 [Pempheris klunzingeri]|uniref:adhesion G-protein coupled receptor F2 n=1 Tax=Pempheris klunzingeri TaxID=3127111 RepID=UPI00398128FA